MPELVSPTVAVHASYLRAVDDLQSEGRHRRLDTAALRDRRRFAAYTAAHIDRAVPRPVTADGLVPETVLWWVEQREFLGRVSIRHSLTAALRRVGGHIGFEVPPAHRGLGHATAMLAAALPVAHRLGLDEVLITCDDDNRASIRVIEANGGRDPEIEAGIRRYRLATPGVSSSRWFR